ncbi:hypothetical protein DPEC_G00078350 [Dallia pectoralis]|uniref:Uncharacterized protein n=1 Tax=Dallia pectoralis TaxID=75939 RepID=A0ACC2H503_DALPE|nr:hypothetical protein DPEC_G00078350 [Dallia pectoralis]
MKEAPGHERTEELIKEPVKLTPGGKEGDEEENKGDNYQVGKGGEGGANEQGDGRWIRPKPVVLEEQNIGVRIVAPPPHRAL